MTDEGAAQVEHDLTLAAAWCEYKFPGARQLVLFAAVQRESRGNLAIIMADYGNTTTRKGPVVEEATRAMKALGYSFHWQTNGDLDFVLSVSGRCISNHTRLRAVGIFLDAGLG